MTTVVYGKKIGMGEAYLGDVRRGVTKIALSPMTISQIKTVDKDGYSAAQVGFRSPKKHTRRKVEKTAKSRSQKAWKLAQSFPRCRQRRFCVISRYF